MCCRCRSTKSRRSAWKRWPAAFAFGAGAVRFLLRGKPRHDRNRPAQDHRAGAADPRRPRLCRRARRDDRDRRSRCARRSLRAIAPMDGAAKPATFAAVGNKREVMRLALRELHGAAPAPVDVIALPEGAPFGTVNVNVEGCTLCLSCVSACPTGALSDDPRTADAALCRGRLRAMRAVQGDLPGESHQPHSRRSISAPPPRQAA